MSAWPVKRTTGSHRVLAQTGWPDVVFAFRDGDEIGPQVLARIERRTSFLAAFAPRHRLPSTDGGNAGRGFALVKLLPLAEEPLVAPTDRDMLPSERREFVRTHRTCIFGYARRADGPSMSVVYYVPTDEDELLISTMRGRSKTKAVTRTGKVSLCVLDERWPFAYLQVYCDARLDDDPTLVVDVMMAVGARMSGETLPEEARPVVEAMAKDEERVVIRCRPYSTFAQPPRHLHRNDQEERITHWITAAMPWGAPDQGHAPLGERT